MPVTVCRRAEPGVRRRDVALALDARSRCACSGLSPQSGRANGFGS